ncbi:MAG: outer membrane protein assembly factor BamD [Phycisphaeraceae bacterium]
MNITRMQRADRLRARWGGWLIASLAVVVLLGGATAGAQDRYELGDDAWQLAETAEPGSPAGQLQQARRALAEEKPKRAEPLASDWIDAYPDHPLMPVARMVRGDARVAMGREYRALFDYEYVIRLFPESPQYHAALEREYEIADRFTRGRRRHLWGMRILTAYSEGEELLIRIQERAPGSELGEQASLTLADYYYRAGDMADAAEAYDLFLLNYPQSSRRERAMRRLILANLARVAGPAFDPTGLLEAGERLRVYREEFPAGAEQLGADAIEMRIEESLADKDLRSARWHEQRGERVSAAYLYQRLLADHPQTTAAVEANERLAALDLPVNPGLSARGRQGRQAEDEDADREQPEQEEAR